MTLIIFKDNRLWKEIDDNLSAEAFSTPKKLDIVTSCARNTFCARLVIFPNLQTTLMVVVVACCYTLLPIQSKGYLLRFQSIDP